MLRIITHSKNRHGVVSTQWQRISHQGLRTHFQLTCPITQEEIPNSSNRSLSNVEKITSRGQSDAKLQIQLTTMTRSILESLYIAATLEKMWIQLLKWQDMSIRRSLGSWTSMRSERLKLEWCRLSRQALMVPKFKRRNSWGRLLLLHSRLSIIKIFRLWPYLRVLSSVTLNNCLLREFRVKVAVLRLLARISWMCTRVSFRAIILRGKSGKSPKAPIRTKMTF